MTHINNVKIFHHIRKIGLLVGFGLMAASSFSFAGLWSFADGAYDTIYSWVEEIDSDYLNIELGDSDEGISFIINGNRSSSLSGHSVSSAGDVNGDGIDDLIISAPRSYDAAGASYVIYGSRDGDNMHRGVYAGFRIIGSKQSTASGWSVSAAGDVNADGVDDLIIGAPFYDRNRGVSYVVYGKTGFREEVNLSDFDNGTDLGFKIIGANRYDHSGWSVSGAGDVNADGIDDLIIGAPNFDHERGASYVVYGKTGGREEVNLSDFDGNTLLGFRFRGRSQNDKTGWSVSAAGDVNADGIDDVIIGTPGLSYKRGISHVVYGIAGDRDNVYVRNWQFDKYAGFEIRYVYWDSGKSGYSVSGAGDVNGDGFDDLIIGTPYADSEGQHNNGASYVVYGKTAGRPDVLLWDFDSYPDLGFRIIGADENDRSGWSVSAAGDVNADGYDDVIIGALRRDTESRGISYVVYGSDSAGKVRLSDFDNSTSAGFSITGAHKNDKSGWSVSAAGDVNADGYDDVIIGACDANKGRGASYLVYGAPSKDTGLLAYNSIDSDNDGVDNRSDAFPFDASETIDSDNDGVGDNADAFPNDRSETVDNDGVGDNADGFPYDPTTSVDSDGDNSSNGGPSEPTVTVNKNFNIAVNKNATPPHIRFGKSKFRDPHYLPLDDSIFDGLTELTIEMDFKLDFSRFWNREHAYLLSLAESDNRDNVLSIFLKDRNRDGEWDLSIWAQDGNGNDQKIFLHENFIANEDQGTLSVAVNFSGYGETKVYWAPADLRGGDRFIVNRCLSSHRYHKECRGNLSGVGSISAGRGGAVFGNDQDALAGRFDHKQAFEGELYGLKVFNKFFDPSSSSARTDTGAELIYSLSPGSVQ